MKDKPAARPKPFFDSRQKQPQFVAMQVFEYVGRHNDIKLFISKTVFVSSCENKSAVSLPRSTSRTLLGYRDSIEAVIDTYSFAPELSGFMYQFSSPTTQVQNVLAAFQGSHSKYLRQPTRQGTIFIESGSFYAAAGIQEIVRRVFRPNLF
jgi:hypothetical protein